MKTLIVYSSRTGNTKQVGEAIAAALDGSGESYEIHPIENAPAPASLEAFGLICLGYWVDKGLPDEKCRNYLAGLNGKKVALFGTLGAWPDSDHARECIAKSEELARREGANSVLGSFMCQGKVDPKILEVMQKMAGDQHPMTPERIARIEEAKKHPDAEDLRRAGEAFLGFVQAAKS